MDFYFLSEVLQNTEFGIYQTLDLYYLKEKNNIIGILCYDFSKKKFHLVLNPEIENYVIPWFKSDADNFNINFRNFLESRIIMESRPETPSVLAKLNLRIYNQWDIARRTKMMCLEDTFYITKDINDEYYDTHLRNLAKNKYISTYEYLGIYPIVRYPLTEYDNIEWM